MPTCVQVLLARSQSSVVQEDVSAQSPGAVQQPLIGLDWQVCVVTLHVSAVQIWPSLQSASAVQHPAWIGCEHV